MAHVRWPRWDFSGCGELCAKRDCGLAVSETSIYLNGKGFLKVRRDRGLQRNLYFYQYAFVDRDGQKQRPQYLKITDGKA